MTRFIIFASLLAAQFAAGVSDTVVRVTDGDSMRLRVDQGPEATKCELETNTGEKFNYEANAVFSHERISNHFTEERCSVTVVSVQATDVGVWTITARYDKSAARVFRFKVLLEQKEKVIPTNDVSTVEGQFVFAKMAAHLGNVKSCALITPNGTKVDLLNGDRGKFQRYGECGFYALLIREDGGKWTLQAIGNDSVVHTGDLTIGVSTLPEEPTEMVLRLKRGMEGDIHLNLQTTVTFCQLEDPSGVKTEIMTETCTYRIPTVTTRHDGVWTASYGLRGKVSHVALPFKVVTYEPKSIDGNVTLTENNEIQLLCHSYDSNEQIFAFCQFTRPDGYVLNMSPGVGTIIYSVFESSKPGDEDTDFYCGLIIHEPRDQDYGGWKCGIGSSRGDYSATTIYVDPRLLNASDTINFVPGVKVRTKDVHAKHGDSYQIKCTADMALRYCWFISPNGTAYSLSRYKNTPLSLPYVGSGLSAGECGARIDYASFTDQGEWTCNVGVANGTEESRTFRVVVEESYIVPDYSEITARGGSNVTLTCSILPSVADRAVDYCRWIRPDGYGIYSGVSHRYTSYTSNTRCKLIIAAEGRGADDVGRWTCVAGLLGTGAEEAWATVTVLEESLSYSTWIGGLIAAAVLALIIVVTTLCWIRVRNGRRASPKDPPTGSLEPNATPRFLNEEDDTKEFRY